MALFLLLIHTANGSPFFFPKGKPSCLGEMVIVSVSFSSALGSASGASTPTGGIFFEPEKIQAAAPPEELSGLPRLLPDFCEVADALAPGGFFPAVTRSGRVSVFTLWYPRYTSPLKTSQGAFLRSTPGLLDRLAWIPPHLCSSLSQHPDSNTPTFRRATSETMSSRATMSSSVSALFEDTLLIFGYHYLLNYSLQLQSPFFPWGSILVFTRLVRLSSRAVSTV